jgi:hypothetical protein
VLGSSARAPELKVLIDLVAQLYDGAIAPYPQKPLVWAVLLPAVTFTATAEVSSLFCVGCRHKPTPSRDD